MLKNNWTIKCALALGALIGFNALAAPLPPIVIPATPSTIKYITVTKKNLPECTNASFASEVAAQATTTLVGYKYAVKKLSTAYGYAYVDSTESITVSGVSFTSWATAATYMQNLQGVAAADFRNALTVKLQEVFDNRMFCVKFKGFASGVKAQLSPYNSYIDTNLGYTQMESLYPTPANPTPATIAILDTARTSDQYPQFFYRIRDIAPNFVNLALADPAFPLTEANIQPVTDGTPYHFDMLAGAVLSMTPDNISAIQVHMLWGAEGLGQKEADAIQWVVDHAVSNNTRVMNLSWADEVAGNTPDVEKAINNATAAGIVVVQAVGNDFKYTPPADREVRPTATEIKVGSITADGKILSRYGDFGTDILVQTGGSFTTASHDSYGTFAERSVTFSEAPTSLATAEVSGFISRMLTNFPWMTVAQVKESIYNSGDSLATYTAGTAEENAEQALARMHINHGKFSPIAATAYAMAHFPKPAPVAPITCYRYTLYPTGVLQGCATSVDAACTAAWQYAGGTGISTQYNVTQCNRGTSWNIWQAISACPTGYKADNTTHTPICVIKETL